MGRVKDYRTNWALDHEAGENYRGLWLVASSLDVQKMTIPRDSTTESLGREIHISNCLSRKNKDPGTVLGRLPISSNK